MMRVGLTVLLLATCTAPLLAGNWTQFRGPAAGKVKIVTHPTRWSQQENVAWAMPMKGSGWSSPVVVGDKILLTYAASAEGGKPKGMQAGVASMRDFRNAKPSSHEFVVSCLQLGDGQELWSQTAAEAVPPVVHPSNTYATESPATDGKLVFTLFATTGTLSAWDLAGNRVWQRELGRFTAGNGFGTGSSLAVADERVFVQFDNDQQSFVAAFDTQTGEPAWRDERRTRTSWSSPVVWETSAGKQLVTCGSGTVTSYDPATGDINWKVNGMQSGFSGSPAIDGSRIYFGNSGPRSAGPLVAIGAQTRGEVSLDRDFKAKQLAWSRVKSGPGMSSPVVAEELLFVTGSGSILNCYEASSGERVYRQRVPDMKTVVASLWADDQRLFILDEQGATHVVRIGRKFELLGRNELDDLTWSTPTLAQDTLLIRGVEKLYCIRAQSP